MDHVQFFRNFQHNRVYLTFTDHSFAFFPAIVFSTWGPSMANHPLLNIFIKCLKPCMDHSYACALNLKCSMKFQSFSFLLNRTVLC